MAAELTAVVDLAGARELLRGIAGAVQDLSPVFRGPIDRATTEALVQQFETKGVRLNGAPWQPLSPTTIALRTRVVRRQDRSTGQRTARTINRAGRARAGFATPLRDTNRLWASLTKSGAPEGLRVITESSYERGTRVPYAAKHQRGFTITQMFGRPLRAPKRVPARPLVPTLLPRDLVASYEAAIAAYVVDGRL